MREDVSYGMPHGGRGARRGDVRRGIGWVLDSVSARLLSPGRPERLLGVFADAVAEVVGEGSQVLVARGRGLGPGVSRRVDPDGAWQFAIPGMPAVIEVRAVDAPPDEWHVQFLSHCAGLAALLVDVDTPRPGPTRPRPSRGPDVPGLVGHSQSMQRLRDRVARVARSDAPVLISGESGVGKELVARHVHTWSPRAHGPFVAVNCASIVDSLFEAELFGIEDRAATGVRGRRGKFELADGGTIFLDEIGDLPLVAQAKLLRVLQDFLVERVGSTDVVKVDVRVVAATNRDIGEMVQRGAFRLDLFHRLNGIDVTVPPLRAHAEDLPELVEHALRRLRRDSLPSVAPAALAALREYHWPGNVRELERVVERAVALGDGGDIDVEHLPLAVTARFRELVQPAVVARDSARGFLVRYARTVYERCGGNKRETCRVLDISYHTLRAYLDAAGVDATSCRTTPATVHRFVPESVSAAATDGDPPHGS